MLIFNNAETRFPMLVIRPNCENCNKDLAPDSTEAMICSYECTFCKECAEEVLENVCPNCSGGFEKRPVRPKNSLNSNPASSKRIYKAFDLQSHRELILKYAQVSPSNR